MLGVVIYRYTVQQASNFTKRITMIEGKRLTPERATRSRMSSCDDKQHLDIACCSTNTILSERALPVTAGCEASETMHPNFEHQ